MKPTSPLNREFCFKYFILFFCAAIYPYSQIQAQDLITKANQLNDSYKQEKIYLHIDRPSYWANEDLWFKAYLKDSPKPDCNLYVELLNEKGNVVYKDICWAQNGLAYGDMHLADTLSSGMYQLRAYTNWMRNFDEQWFFRRDLVIWNLRDKAKPTKPVALKEREVDFQFFPEGGTFLSGVKNQVAFKAIDRNGKGIDVKGVVLDEKGRQVAMIKSAFKGMGSFEITPEPGKKYLAELTIAGDLPMNADLPEAFASGVSISYDAKDTSHIRLEVHTNGITGGGKYQLIGQSGGKVCYKEDVSVNPANGIIAIDKEKFPTGIVRFTLFDMNKLPQCERLVFINHHDQVSLQIEAEEEEYHPREKVILDISALDKDESPIQANLSVSAYQTETMYQTESYPENILTRFLLSSELKGRIEEPAYYFKDDSLSTLLALDNLMLTHGYRYFQWKQLMENKPVPIVFKPERGIKIKGTIKTSFTERQVANGNVSLVFLHDTLKTYQAVTDSSGYFEFKDFYFRDTLAVFLEAKNAKGRKSTFIELDKSSWESPQVKILPLNYSFQDDKKVTVTFNKDNYMNINKKWHLSDTILLNEVRVATSKYKFGERPLRLHDKADYALDLNTDDDELGNVFHKLEDKFSNIIVTVKEEGKFVGGTNLEGYRSWDVLQLSSGSPTVRIDYNPHGPVYVLDGKVVDEDLINKIPAGAFKRVEILKKGTVYGNFLGGAVCFFTKYGAFKALPNSQGEKNSRIPGYSVIRRFYSPNYENLPPQEIKDDFRNTLYWNPMIETDSEGLTWISFYNSDQTGEVRVIVEGLTKEGKICKGLYKYSVIPAKNKGYNSAF